MVARVRAETGQSTAVTEMSFAVPVLKWWKEAALTLIFYGVYTAIRNQFGSALGGRVRRRSYENALDVINIEKAMGLYFEEWLQQLFVGWDWFIVFWNVFYGSFHFIVTIFVMVWLFWRFPSRYILMRSALAVTTAVALVGFAFYPLMPPRLLPNCVSPYGACAAGHNYVDTLVDPGGLWSFESGTMAAISNQYAAMPSLHIAWALWCAIGLYPLLKHRATRILAVMYPLFTLFSIVVTANHYWIDAIGGIVIVAIGLRLAPKLTPFLPGGSRKFRPATQTG